MATHSRRHLNTGFAIIVMSIFIGCTMSNSRQKPNPEDQLETEDGQQDDGTGSSNNNTDAGTPEQSGDASDCTGIRCPAFAPLDTTTCSCVIDSQYDDMFTMKPLVIIEDSCESPDLYPQPNLVVTCQYFNGTVDYDLCSRNSGQVAGTPCCDTESMVCGFDSGEGCEIFSPPLYGNSKDFPSICNGGDSRRGWVYDDCPGSLVAQNDDFFFFLVENRNNPFSNWADRKFVSMGKADCQSRVVYQYEGTAYPTSYAATRDILYLVTRERDNVQTSSGEMHDPIRLMAVPLSGDQPYTVDIFNLLNAELVSNLGPLTADEDILYVPIIYRKEIDNPLTTHRELIAIPCCDLQPKVLVSDFSSWFLGSSKLIHSGSRLYSLWSPMVSDLGSVTYFGYLDIWSGESRLLFDAALGSLSTLAVYANHIYLAQVSNMSNIMEFDLDNCDLKRVVGTNGRINNIAADAEYLYWAESHFDHGWIFAMSYTDGVRRAIAETPTGSYLISVDEEFIYWSEAHQEDSARLVRVPKPMFENR